MTKTIRAHSKTTLSDAKQRFPVANADQQRISSYNPTAIVFAYHNIGCIGINALLEAGFHIQAVFTHLDDCNETQFFDSVAELAAQHDLPVFTANNINHPLWIERAKTLAPDFIFSFYYRDILNEDMLCVARYGAFNLHGSLLPKFRGCAPVNWAIIEGETQTGVTLHKMVAQCDAGDIVAQSVVDIIRTDTAFSLHQKLASAAESLLKNTLPNIINNSYSVTKQDHSIATYYARRSAKDGEINWQQNALRIHNLVRAVTQPYPGAYTYLNGKKLIIWETELIEPQTVNRFINNQTQHIKIEHTKTEQVLTGQNYLLADIEPGTIICTDPLIIACTKTQSQPEPRIEAQLQDKGFTCITEQPAKNENANYQTSKSQFLLITRGQIEGGLQLNGRRLAQSLGLVPKLKLGVTNQNTLQKKTRVLILGVNGFIGNHLTERLLKSSNYEVYGMDISHDAIKRFINHPRFHFVEGDITIHTEWIAYHIKKCDVILPLVAIATPIQYTQNPLRVFELDFEENLKIIRHCVKYQKRVIFPSTSEVYGMCDDPFFDENHSKLIVGPIHKQRWIYSTSKQLLDRIIWAYGQSAGLKFTLFRPFNWMGPRLDSLDAARVGSSRAITQLILNLVEGTPIKLVDGGEQKRCFTDIKDGIEALFRIIENEQNLCDGQIINIGNPENEASIKTLADCLLTHFNQHPLRNQFPPFAGFQAIDSFDYYGEGYEDVSYRKPSIKNAQRLLNWQPNISLDSTIESTLDYFLQTAFSRMPTSDLACVENSLSAKSTEPYTLSEYLKTENPV